MNTAEINKKKVLASKAFLLDIIKNPSDYKADAGLFNALKSQSGLAKYENRDREIAVCSLNTLKSATESLLDRGFLELDELRINARNALESALVGSTANSKTRTGLKNKVDKLQIEADILRKRNFLLSSIIDELRGDLKEMAFNSQDQQQIDKYREINKRLEAKLSFTLDEKV